MRAATRLRLDPGAEARIRSHAARTYPHECCGALIGRDTDEAREVRQALPLPNQRVDSPHNRFSLAPQDILAAERTARAMGLELVGWYHSHPDHPARPSRYDREQAWPWYSYVIVAVEGGASGELTSWRLADDRGAFVPEAVEIAARPAEAVARAGTSRLDNGDLR